MKSSSLDYRDENLTSTASGNSLSIQQVLPQLLDVDFTDVTDFAVPVVQFLDRHDQMAPVEPVARWMEDVHTPYHAVQWFEDSAHMPMYEEPGHFLTALLSYLHPRGSGPF